MTVKQRLHELIDALPVSEEQTAARVLEALSATADPVLLAHARAPMDDEPETPEERAAVLEAREDIRAGRLHPLEEVKRELGL